MQKAPKPSLTGQRIKTRKRDEKEKYDPVQFRDTILTGLYESVEDNQINLEKATDFLTKQGQISDYRRYAEAFFDVLFTGGLLEPGGTIKVDTEMDIPEAPYCVFRTDIGTLENRNIKPMESLIDHLFGRVIRQFKYLEKSLNEEMKKVCQFMKTYTDEQLERLAVAMYILIHTKLCSEACLTSLLKEHLVANGTSLSFTKIFFLTWLQQKDAASLISTLKKAEIDNKLLELWPLSKRSVEVFQEYFSGAELQPIVDFQLNQVAIKATKDLKAKLKKRMQGNENEDEEKTQNEKDEAHAQNIKDIITLCNNSKLPDKSILEILWVTTMKAVEWNKKEDLLADQAFRHIRKHVVTLKAFTRGLEDNEAKMIELVQDHCFDNISFIKIFQKIIKLLYDADVLDEEAILQWYKLGITNKLNSKKGLTVFLEQMEKFVAWLKTAAEESDEEDDDEDEEDDEAEK